MTTVTWSTSIKNDTIYDINQIKVKFACYYDDDKVAGKALYYSPLIEHGSTQFISYTFDVNREVNKVGISAWEAVSYSSVWESYQVWFILTIVICSILTILFLFIIFKDDLELKEIFDLIGAGASVCTPLLILDFLFSIEDIAGSIFDWVPLVIVSGGLLGIVILVLLGYLIKVLINTRFYKYISEDEIEKYKNENNFVFAQNTKYYTFSNNNNNITECLNDKESLLEFSLSSLKEFCRENEIKGFSALNKDDLVDLIMDWQAQETNKVADRKTFNSSQNNSVKEKQGIKFDDIAGLENAKEIFKEKVILPYQHPDLFERFGKKAGGGILLYGLPGTGKTMFAEAASNELNALFIPVMCSDIKSKWYGESEKNIKDIFTKARKSGKAIIFFDEFEAIGSKRTDDPNDLNNGLVPEILAEMQGINATKSKSTILVIAATNKPWSIDSAFLRPGRFDEKILITLPDFEARKKLFEIQLSKVPVSDDLDYCYLASITEGLNGADIKEVCEKLKMNAIKDSLEKGVEQTIGMDDVEMIKDKIKSSVSHEDIEQLKTFEKELV